MLVGLLTTTVLGQEDAVKKEYARFRGTWKFVSMEIEGVKVTPDQFRDARLVCDGENFTMMSGGETYKGTFKLDISKTPRQFDAVFTDGPEKGKTARAIYKLEGDTYTVCIAIADKDRPKEFASKPGSGHVLEVLKREKP